VGTKWTHKVAEISISQQSGNPADQEHDDRTTKRMGLKRRCPFATSKMRDRVTEAASRTPFDAKLGKHAPGLARRRRIHPGHHRKASHPYRRLGWKSA